MLNESALSSLVINRHKFVNLQHELCSDWEKLACSVKANFSLYPGWTHITAASHQIIESCKLVAARQGPALVAALPLVTTNIRSLGMGLRKLELVSNRASYHNACVSELPPDTVLELLVSEAIQQQADFIHLAGIPDDSDLASAMNCAGTSAPFYNQKLPAETSPYLPLQSSWEELLAAKSKKFRYKTRKREDLLNTTDELKMSWYNKQDECDELLHAMRIVEERSWKKDAGLSIFERKHERMYYENLLPFLAANRAMYANVLFFKSQPIAYSLCCIWDGWVGQQKTSFDYAHGDKSPGSIVIDHAIRYAIDLGAREFDFLGDPDRHKLAWSKLVRSHTDYFLYLKSRPKGRLFGYGKQLLHQIKRGRDKLHKQL